MTNRFDQISIRVNENQSGKTVLKFLMDEVGISTRMIRRSKNHQMIDVNGHVISVNAKLRNNDVVTIQFLEEPHNIMPEEMPIDVLYEDEDLVVINKPFGAVAHPTKGHPHGTLSNGMRYYALSRGEDYKPRLVNRLDRDTTGVMIFAKNAYGQHVVSEEMKADRVDKYYTAVVHGRLQKDAGEINEPIEREEEEGMKRIVRPDGKASLTLYEVTQRLKNATVVRIKLMTGRTHQIRVHMAHLGHPLVGDTLYGSFERMLIKRQALHATSMTFLTPRHGVVTVEAPLPTDLLNLIGHLH